MAPEDRWSLSLIARECNTKVKMIKDLVPSPDGYTDRWGNPYWFMKTAVPWIEAYRAANP